jgi:hypothetical protein
VLAVNQGNGGVTNTGLFEATGGGTLQLYNTIANSGGNITANGGTVRRAVQLHRAGGVARRDVATGIVDGVEQLQRAAICRLEQSGIGDPAIAAIHGKRLTGGVGVDLGLVDQGEGAGIADVSGTLDRVVDIGQGDAAAAQEGVAAATGDA